MNLLSWKRKNGPESTAVVPATVGLAPLTSSLDTHAHVPVTSGVPMNALLGQYPWVTGLDNLRLKNAAEESLGAALTYRPTGSSSSTTLISVHHKSHHPRVLPMSPRSTPKPPMAPPLHPDGIRDMTRSLIQEGTQSLNHEEQAIAASLQIFTDYMCSLCVLGGPDKNALLDPQKQLLIAFLYNIFVLRTPNKGLQIHKRPEGGVKIAAGTRSFQDRAGDALAPFFEVLMNKMQLDTVRHSAHEAAKKHFG